MGLNFGSLFLATYIAHPDVAELGIVDANVNLLTNVGDKYSISKRYRSLDQLIADGSWDAVHICTPLNLHALQAKEAMEGGLHVASAVTAGSSLSELADLVGAQRATGRTYMMMETSIYSREFLYVKELYKSGVLGRIQYMRGAHFQDLTGYPDYWLTLPPMHYSTHALAPLLHLLGASAKSVSCVPSGSRQAPYEEYFPIEVATFELEGPDADKVIAVVTRSMVEAAVEMKESFDIFGDKATFLWRLTEQQSDVVIRLGPEVKGQRERAADIEYPDIPYRIGDLPAALRDHSAVDRDRNSLPHLVHEFVRSIIEARQPLVDVNTAANWTAAGLMAHESAIAGGTRLDIPIFVDP